MWGRGKAAEARREAEEHCQAGCDIAETLKKAISETEEAARGVLDRFVRRGENKNVQAAE